MALPPIFQVTWSHRDRAATWGLSDNEALYFSPEALGLPTVRVKGDKRKWVYLRDLTDVLNKTSGGGAGVGRARSIVGHAKSGRNDRSLAVEAANRQTQQMSVFDKNMIGSDGDKVNKDNNATDPNGAIPTPSGLKVVVPSPVSTTASGSPAESCTTSASASSSLLTDGGHPVKPSTPRKSVAASRQSVSYVDSAALDEAREKAQKVLCNYFYAQLDLLAHMCLNRQLNCIFALEEEYHYELCVIGMSDQRLPAAIRSGFTLLMDHLWLRRAPHQDLQLPARIRDLSCSVQGSEGDVGDMAALEDADMRNGANDNAKSPLEISRKTSLTSSDGQLNAGPMLSSHLRSNVHTTLSMLDDGDARSKFVPRFTLSGKSAEQSLIDNCSKLSAQNNQLPKNLVNFYQNISPNKFQLIVSYVIGHMKSIEGKLVHADTIGVDYTARLMRITLQLLRTGFVSNASQIDELMKATLLAMDGRTDWLKDDREMGYLTPRTKMEFGNSNQHSNWNGSHSRMTVDPSYPSKFGAETIPATSASAGSNSGDNGSNRGSGGVVNNVISNLLGSGSVAVEDSADPLLQDTSMNNIDVCDRNNPNDRNNDPNNAMNVTTPTELGTIVAEVKQSARSNRSDNRSDGQQWSARSQPQQWSARSQQIQLSARQTEGVPVCAMKTDPAGIFPPTDGAESGHASANPRYRESPKNIPMFHCKRAMAEVCEGANSIALDYSLARIVAMFEENVEKSLEERKEEWMRTSTFSDSAGFSASLRNSRNSSSMRNSNSLDPRATATLGTIDNVVNFGDSNNMNNGLNTDGRTTTVGVETANTSPAQSPLLADQPPDLMQTQFPTILNSSPGDSNQNLNTILDNGEYKLEAFAGNPRTSGNAKRGQQSLSPIEGIDHHGPILTDRNAPTEVTSCRYMLCKGPRSTMCGGEGVDGDGNLNHGNANRNTRRWSNASSLFDMMDSADGSHPLQTAADKCVSEILKSTKDFSFDRWLGGNFRVMLLDLLMYQDTELFNQILKVLFSTNRTKELLQHAKKVFLVVGDKQKKKITRLKADVDDLINLFATYECWGVGDSFGSVQGKKVKLYCYINFVRM